MQKLEQEGIKGSDPFSGMGAPYVVVVLLAVVLGGVAACRQAQSQTGGSRRSDGVAVEVAAVKVDTLRETVRGIGTLVASETVEIAPEVEGFIRKIDFEEGGAVKEGQLLFSIDDRKLRARLAAAKAAFQMAKVRTEDAQRRLKRVQLLMGDKVADQDELDEADTDFRAAKADVERTRAEVELAGIRLDDTRLVAPFDGMISQRSADVGDYVKVGDHLATLYRVSQMEIALSLPERYMGRVRIGQEVAVEVVAYPDRQFSAKVRFVSPHVSEATRNILVKAAIEDPDGSLKPGAFAAAVVTLGLREQCPVIVEESLVATREGYLVFVVTEQVARSRRVLVGLRSAGTVEILDGLMPGEQVVRTGHMSLSDGTKVHIVRAENIVRDENNGRKPEQGEAAGANGN